LSNKSKENDEKRKDGKRLDKKWKLKILGHSEKKSLISSKTTKVSLID